MSDGTTVTGSGTTGEPKNMEYQHLLPDTDLAEWEAAIDEYEAQQADEELPEEDGNEWF